MDAAERAPFERGRNYTRGEIQAAFGGSRRAAFVTKARTVVCLCLTREKNPRAPDEMVIGGREPSLRLAREFAASGAAVPVFVRAARGGWDYAGQRRVRAAVDDPGALLALIAEGAPGDAALALLLEEPPNDPPGGSHGALEKASPATGVIAGA